VRRGRSHGTAARALLALLVVAGAVALAGCRVGRAGGRAVVSLLDSPRKVDKLTQPIDKEARLAVLWVGHATALVQIDDKVVLTDPVFTSSVGQVSKRVVEPGVDPENLPPIDAVMISHLHFDHLSLGSLSLLERKIRMLLMPRGGATYLTDFGFPVLELRPWQAWEQGGLRVTAVPVDHVGWRYGIDEAWMTESFTGYVIEYHGLKVYFGGDTAYDQRLFTEPGQRFPGLDVALLPIAPIEPRELMRRVHMDPREALQAFFDLGARSMVPIHYDTFVNSTDNPGDALAELSREQRRWSIGERQVVPIAVGQRHAFVKKGETPRAFDRNAKPAPASGSGTGGSGNGGAPAPTGAGTSAPAPGSNIPDDDRLD